MTELIDPESDDEMDLYLDFEQPPCGPATDSHCKTTSLNPADTTIMLLTQHIQWLENQIRLLTCGGNKGKNRNKKAHIYSKRYQQLLKEQAKNKGLIDRSDLDVRLLEFVDYCIDQSQYVDPVSQRKMLTIRLPQLFDEISNGRDAFSREQFYSMYRQFPGDLKYIFDRMVGCNKRVSWKRYSLFMIPFIS